MKRASDAFVRHALCAGAIAASVVLAPASARAQTAAQKASARSLFDEGKKRRDSGDAAGALESFKAADAIMNVPTTKLAVARAYLKLGRLVEARETALKIAFIPASPKEPPPFVDARTAADQLAEELAAKIPTLTITLVNPPAGEAVQLLLDGIAVPADARLSPRKVDPGRHTVVARAAGREATGELTIAEGESKTVTLDLTAPKPMVADASPPVAATPAPGGSRSPLLWVGIAVAVVGAGVGTTGGLISMGKKDDADALCRDGRCPPAAHEDVDGAKTWATISTIGFVTAGVGVALAGVGLALGRSAPPDAERSARITPVVGFGTAGFTGSF